ncbi:hypothetical protein V8B97DRAFT_1672142 [Scleroderma yunnanense]
MLRRTATTLHLSSPRVCQRKTHLLMLERRFSDLATSAATLPRRSTSLGGSILTRSSNRPALPSSNERPPRQQRLQDGQGRANPSRSAGPRRSDQNRTTGGNGKREVVRSAYNQVPRHGGGTDGKMQPALVENARNSNTAEQSLDWEDASDQKHPTEQHRILSKNILAELLPSRVYSAQHTKGRGGDYSGCLPPAVTCSLSNLGPVERAQLALGRNKQIPFKLKNQALDIIKQNVDRPPRTRL